MDRIAVFFAAIVPALLLIAYGRSKTRIEWSNEALWNAFLLGGVGAIGALPIELVLGYLLKQSTFAPLTKAAIDATVIAAVVEESIKFGILVGSAIHHVDRRRLADIVMLALAVSLGFAAVENIFYLAAPGEWQARAAGRALTAVPGHGLDGLAMGSLVVLAKLRPERSWRYFALALIVPVAMHSAYDFPLFATEVDNWWGWQWAWTASFAASAVVAIALCNRVLPLAFEADRLAGLGSTAVLRIRYLVIGAVILIPVGLVPAIIPFVGVRPDLIATGIVVAVMPLAFGFDFLFEIFRRRRMTRAIAGPDALIPR